MLRLAPIFFIHVFKRANWASIRVELAHAVPRNTCSTSTQKIVFIALFFCFFSQSFEGVMGLDKDWLRYFLLAFFSGEIARVAF